MQRLHTSIRVRLTAAIVVPLVIAVVLCWVVGISLVNRHVVTLAQQVVERNLVSARQILAAEGDHLADAVRLAARHPELTALLGGESPGAPFDSVMRNTLVSNRLSFLTVVDRYGNVCFRATGAPSAGRIDRTEGEVVYAALQGLSGTETLAVLTGQGAGREGPALATAALLEVRATPHARPYAKRIEDRGLYLTAAAPIRGGDGEVVGAIWGGALLNNRADLVDRIAQVLFHDDRSGMIPSGNTTLFLDDLRIATTVRNQSGERAVGTLMATDVHDAIQNGEKWQGRAFVVDAWHLAAYEPLFNLRKEVVGALYVGIPEEAFERLRTRINLTFGAILVVLLLGGGGVAAWLGSSLTRPVRQLEAGVRRVAAGEEIPDLVVAGRDEIAALAAEFNQMKGRLDARRSEVLTLNRTLEEKVEERSAELARKTEELLAAQAELARSERLAAVGLLAAGVAHEINNPLAIIRGNAELLQEGEEAETIVRQSVRIERIVSNLLTFSRGGELRLGEFSPATLIDNVLRQIGHQVPLDGYRLHSIHHSPERTICGDEDQLRQVFTNLILNGLQVMPEGGVLTVETRFAPDDAWFLASVIDTGPGIPPEQRAKLFTPFFTTRRGGTGLGLAISYAIVRDHGGEIRVEDPPGRGASFTVTLPATGPRVAPSAT